VHAELAHVAERHRRAGWVFEFWCHGRPEGQLSALAESSVDGTELLFRWINHLHFLSLTKTEAFRAEASRSGSL
jgi:hypothetical protein